MPEESEYNNVHRAFLQACANWGCWELNEAMKVFQAIELKFNKKDAGESEMREIIQTINDKIRQFEQKISFITFDQDNKEYVVFANTSAGAIEKLQVVYTDAEIEFFRLLLKEIALLESHNIRPMIALNLINKIEGHKKLTMNRAQELIEMWSIGGYFVECDEMLCFGPRTQAEFGQYLKTHYPDTVNLCPLCSSAVFKGVKCDQSNCQALLHRNCMRKFLAKNSNCPKCKKLWNVRLSS